MIVLFASTMIMYVYQLHCPVALAFKFGSLHYAFGGHHRIRGTQKPITMVIFLDFDCKFTAEMKKKNRIR